MSSRTIRTKQADQRKDHSQTPFHLGVLQIAGSTVLGITLLASSAIAGGLLGLAISFRNLPDIRILRNYSPNETTYIYDIKGKLLASLHGEANRKVVKLDRISDNLKLAVIAIEDSHFYLHHGINPYSIGRATLVNWKSGQVTEGASTLTMQLVKNIFLSNARTFSRKLAEAVLATRIEQVFSKAEILEMYLNNIYWGHNNYGVQTAAESYFNKPASDLNLAEAAMMAGLIQAPEFYSPLYNDPEKYQQTKRRQRLVLERMRDLGWITPREASDAAAEPLFVGKPTAWRASKAPFITNTVIQELRERFGNESVTQGGMRIQTTIDLRLQDIAKNKVREGYRNLRGRGIRVPDLQVALVAIDPRTQYIKAIVGSHDYQTSQLNRVTQSRRQPGSAFKPFMYYTAFASGKFTPASVVNDHPVSYRDGSGYYEPKNYGGSFAGPVSIFSALTASRNVPAVIVGRQVGATKVIEVCRTLGIESPLQPVLSLPLGSVGVTPLEMASAYATFANNGWRSEPTAIVRVTDSQGNILLENIPQPKLVLNEWATATLTTVLKGVVDGGTGTRARLNRPAAGKTGTTDSETNVWFVGYVPQMATAVWVGDDQNRPLGKGVAGGTHAAPIWRSFMQAALQDQEVKQFHDPAKFKQPSPPKK